MQFEVNVPEYVFFCYQNSKEAVLVHLKVLNYNSTFSYVIMITKSMDTDSVHV